MEITMKARTLLILLIISLVIAAVSIAQPRGGERGEAQLKRIKEKVGLTEEQTTKVKEIMQKAREEARQEFEDNGGDRESMREMIMKRMEKADAEILKLLTKEQKPKYEEYKKERQKEIQERMRERQ